MENLNTNQPMSSEQPQPSRWERMGGRPLKPAEKVVAIILIVIFAFVFYLVIDANKYRAFVQVVAGEGVAGINPTTEALDFGDLARGVTALRRVDIKNGTPMPMYIVMFKTGSIAELMDLSKNNFKLAPREETKIEFSTYIPASAEIDKIYRGRVSLFKIPTFGL